MPSIAVGILLFDGAEPRDFADPYEVLAMAVDPSGQALLHVHNVAARRKRTAVQRVLRVRP